MRYIRFRLHVYGQGKVLGGQVLFTVSLFYGDSHIYIVSLNTRRSYAELKSMFVFVLQNLNFIKNQNYLLQTIYSSVCSYTLTKIYTIVFLVQCG